MLADMQEQMDACAAALNEWEAAQDAPQVTKLVALVNKGVGVVELVVTSAEEAAFALYVLNAITPNSPIVRNLIAVPFEHVGEVGETVAIEYVNGQIYEGNDVVRVVRLQLPY